MISPVTVGHDVVIAHVEPAWPLDPAELGVEHQQPDQPEPEHRHRIAEQRAEPDHLVLPAAAMGGGDDAERNAEHDADDERQERQLEVAGKTRSMSCSTGCEVMTESPKSPCSTFIR